MVWNWAHIHLILNHIPVIVVPLASIMVVIGVWRRIPSVALMADWLFVSAAISAAAVYGSGFFAEDFVVERSIAKHDVIAPHHNAALYALGASVAVAAWSSIMLLKYRGHSQLYLKRSWVTLTAGITASLLLAWTANEGGKIRHTEIRPEGWEEQIKAGDSHSHGSGGQGHSGE